MTYIEQLSEMTLAEQHEFINQIYEGNINMTLKYLSSVTGYDISELKSILLAS